MSSFAHAAIRFPLSRTLVAIGLISAFGSSGCAVLNRAAGGRLPISSLGNDSASRDNGSSGASSGSGTSRASGGSAAGGSVGSSGSGATAPSVKPRHVPPPTGREAEAAACVSWYTGARTELDAILTVKPAGVDQAKALAQRWKDLRWQTSTSCDCTGNKVAGPDGYDVLEYTCRDAELGKKINALQLDAEKAEYPISERIVRAALPDDIKWARGQAFELFRLHDRLPNEGLRALGRDVAKAYEGLLTQTFKSNGGLGKKDNGEVMCVYSTKALPAGGKGSSGFQTHFDGPVTVNVGCRLQGAAEGQSGNIILYWNADTGPMERMLHAVELGASYTLGKKDWVTGSFKLPAGEDFTNTVHYTFDAQVVVRNVWKEETVLSTAVLTWHK